MRFLRWIKNLFLTFQELRSLKWSFLSALVSGLLLTLAFPPMEWGWTAWFGMVPFLVALDGCNRKEACWLSLFFGTVFYYMNLIWLNTLSTINPMVPVGIVFMGMACGTYAGVFGEQAAFVYGKRRHSLSLIAIPALWVSWEYIRAQGELGFPWLFLGHTQVNWLSLIQICEFTGVYGISFVLVMSNVALAELVSAKRSKNKERVLTAIRHCGGVILVVIVMLFYGMYSEIPIKNTQTDIVLSDSSIAIKLPSITVGLVQPGINQGRKMASYMSPNAERRLRLQQEINFINRSQIEAITAEDKDVDLIILPESAVTHPVFNLMDAERRMVERWSRDANAPILFGANHYKLERDAIDMDLRLSEQGQFFNGAWLVDPQSGLSENPYDKMHLVPFGEYGWVLDKIPGLSEMVLGISSFGAGQETRVFEIAGRRLGMVICFESCFPYLIRENVAAGADAIVVITNDAWYKMSSGARRHQTQSIFRAIESRRPVVRVANTGISCVIDRWGRVVESLDLEEGVAKHLVTDLPGSKGETTLYMRPWGEWFAWLCIAFSTIFYAERFICFYRSRGKNKNLEQENTA